MRKKWQLIRILALLLITIYSLPIIADSTKPPQIPVLNWEPRSDWSSVKAHGAVGDGISDDTAAIQKAFDLISSAKAPYRGVTIYFPAGTYRVTDSLYIKSLDKHAIYGVSLIGHGRDTRIVWDGPPGKPMVQAEGMGYSRWIGMEFNGNNKATIGHYHFSNHTFETVHRKLHMAFRNFTEAGVLAEPKKDRFAMAETSFENCLFENCGIGVSFTQFNDYDIIFDGCEFRGCKYGIRTWFSNYYVRNCHFEGSIECDISSNPEHGSSIRRCTSSNSKKFIENTNSVSPLIIENCAVANWKTPDGTIFISGAPVMIFDCSFSSPPPNSKWAVNINSHWQRLISSRNTVPEGLPLYSQEVRKRGNVKIYEIPAGKMNNIPLSPQHQFLKSKVDIPGKVFDAKRDFGAKGDKRTDDTEAIQKTIDAARKHGQKAIAYLPAGTYVIKKTLKVTGKNYYFGGSGMSGCRLDWRGEKDQATILVENPDHITIEHFRMAKKNGIDILQTGTGTTSFVTYNGLFVSRPNEAPFQGGIVCRQLNKQATVLMPCIVGSMRFTDCGDANILVPISFYGSIVVEGKSKGRNGLLGIMTRFSGGKQNVLVKDNNNLIMSDYYSENSGNIFDFAGNQDDPPGRIVIQGAKLHLNQKLATKIIKISNYAGQIFIGPDQFNAIQSGSIDISGSRPVDLFLLGNCFYRPQLKINKHKVANVYLLGNSVAGKYPLSKEDIKTMFGDSVPPEKLPEIADALDELRRLGHLDLKLNHPQVFQKQ